MVGQLDRVTFYEARPDGEYRPHVLPVEGRYFDGQLLGFLAHPHIKHGALVFIAIVPTVVAPRVNNLAEFVGHSVFH